MSQRASTCEEFNFEKILLCRRGTAKALKTRDMITAPQTTSDMNVLEDSGRISETLMPNVSSNSRGAVTIKAIEIAPFGLQKDKIFLLYSLTIDN